MGDTVSTLLFQPPPPSKLKEHKIVWLKTRLGSRIPAFYISYRRQGGLESCRSLASDEIRDSHPQDGITLLYSHANAEDLGSIYPWCKFLSKMLQVNLLAYDYTGYGMATVHGPPSEEHCYADIEAAYAYLRNDLNVPAKNIVLYGRSLGSGPSCHLAAQTALSKKQGKPDPLSGVDWNEEPVGGLILHAPFLSVYRVVIDTGCTLLGDKFPNIDILPMTRSPTMLIHGTSDQIVPFRHSEVLQKAIPGEFKARPLYIDGMSHNNVHSQVRPMFIDRLVEFLYEKVWPQVVVRRGRTFSVKRRTPVWKVIKDGPLDKDRDSEKEQVEKLRAMYAVRSD